MSRKSRRSLKVTHEQPAPVRRENLRVRPANARRERQYRERRQFDYPDLPPSKLEWSDDFARDYQERYSLVDGRPADVVQQMPRNRNDVHLPESSLFEALHSYFQEPRQLVSECVRRSRRRSVLFALHRTNKGSGRGKKHRWTEKSKVRCL